MAQELESWHSVSKMRMTGTGHLLCPVPVILIAIGAWISGIAGAILLLFMFLLIMQEQKKSGKKEEEPEVPPVFTKSLTFVEHMKQGKKELQASRYTEALAEFRLAVDKKPWHATVYYRCAQVLLKMQKQQ